MGKIKAARSWVASALLSVALVFGLCPTAAFAANVTGEDAAPQAVTAAVEISLQADNVFAIPHGIYEVSSTLAESYGYEDAVDPEVAVSALDVLVRAHEVTFGNMFTAEEAHNILEVEDGFISKIYNVETYNCGFAINGAYPHDPEGTYGEWGYTGYLVNEAPVSNYDVVDFFLYQDSYATDLYTWFEYEEQAPTVLALYENQAADLTLRGYSYAYYGSLNDEERASKTEAVADAQIMLVDSETGEMTPVEGAITDKDGVVSLQFTEPGFYYISAELEADADAVILNPWLEVMVLPTFADVNYEGEGYWGWAADWITQAACIGLMTGDRDPVTQELTGYFLPGNPITRAQAVVVLYRMMTGASDTEKWDADSTGFSDVEASAYYTNALNWAVSAGVITGDIDPVTNTPLNTFRPGAQVTRQELALMIWRVLGKPQAQDDGAALAKCIDSTAMWNESVDALKWAASANVMSGKVLSDSTLAIDAYGDAARAEAAKMFVQAYWLLIAEDDTMQA